MFKQYLPAFGRLLLCLLPLLSAGLPAEAKRRLRYTDWQLVFLEDFDTYRDVADMAARSPWQFTPDNGPTLWGNQYEDQYYDRSAISLRDGYAYLTARPLPQPRSYAFQVAGRDTLKQLHFESGWLSLKPEFGADPALGDTARWAGNRGFQYGLFEIRCRFGGGAGTWPAFWLYSGPTEIDVFEGGAGREYSNTVHYNPDTPARHEAASFYLPAWQDLSNDFNIFSAIWTPTEVTFYFNRRRVRTVPASRLPTFPAPATVIVNQAVVTYSDLATWPIGPDGPYSSLVVDYIKVYKLKP
ncbi:glycoside hydrolase family 16 protein [Hymenobacter terrestris]|uniref:Glycoside hydrolase family 16 protein n=1 Tax=Hymenobacter terrestris TaxID=2748310 RepID=A0ABX2Q056_9BACT|nr:glycoside hydrolase family 16 protein [Hymenobacter terrestris]NVO83730.1 glycoside hydrolase family 16 protein [Hymenobacter terrestris]